MASSSKRICLDLEIKTDNVSKVTTISNTSIPSVAPATTITPAPSPPHSLSDQILPSSHQVANLPKEYTHFVECANRSSLQIQETLEELHGW